MLPLTVSALRAPHDDRFGYRPESQALPYHVLSPAWREWAIGERLTRIFQR
jgi:hypothetical protein